MSRKSIRVIEKDQYGIKETELSYWYRQVEYRREIVYDIPFYIPAREKATYQQRIPRVIYQTFKTRLVDPNMYKAICTILEHNPEYDYYFYTDQECENELQERYGPQYVRAFRDLIPGAFKADWWRYCILYDKGGVYLDVDFVARTSLHPYVPREMDFFSCMDLSHHAIYQAIIGSVPRHPFLKATLVLCFENIQSYSYAQGILDVTGPCMMGSAMNIVLQRPPGTNFAEGDFQGPDGTFYRMFTFTDAHVKWKHDNLFGFKYTGYRHPGVSYVVQYHARNIYHSQPRSVRIQVVRNWIETHPYLCVVYSALLVVMLMWIGLVIMFLLK